LAADDDGDGNDGIVDHTRLQQALIASNKKFFSSSGDVLLMIEIMTHIAILSVQENEHFGQFLSVLAILYY
jgi:hypothetical protein